MAERANIGNCSGASSSVWSNASTLQNSTNSRCSFAPPYAPHATAKRRNKQRRHKSALEPLQPPPPPVRFSDPLPATHTYFHSCPDQYCSGVDCAQQILQHRRHRLINANSAPNSSRFADPNPISDSCCSARNNTKSFPKAVRLNLAQNQTQNYASQAQPISIYDTSKFRRFEDSAFKATNIVKRKPSLKTLKNISKMEASGKIQSSDGRDEGNADSSFDSNSSRDKNREIPAFVSHSNSASYSSEKVPQMEDEDNPLSSSSVEPLSISLNTSSATNSSSCATNTAQFGSDSGTLQTPFENQICSCELG